jgi:hypothetical protein
MRNLVMMGLVVAAIFLLAAVAVTSVQASAPGTALGPATPPATAPTTTPAQTLAVETYDGYFVNNTFEPNAQRSLVVLKDQAAFDKVFGAGYVMNDRSHRLAAGVFTKSLALGVVRRGPNTNYSQVSASVQDGVLTLRYTAKQDPPSSATYASPLIVSVTKAGVTKVVFMENGQKVGERAVE